MGLDLRRREFSITKYGESLVTFSDETFQNSNQVIGAKKLCQMMTKRAIGAVIILNNSGNDTPVSQSTMPIEISNILFEHADIFQEPDQLLPSRSVDYAIPLLHDSMPKIKDHTDCLITRKMPWKNSLRNFCKPI